MRLAAFIRQDSDRIVAEWEAFAGTLEPAADGMTPAALRNHIRPMLAFIASDIEEPQSEGEQVDKSRGEKPKQVAFSAAEVHASLRRAGGFNLNQMVAEFRGLRATVSKLWQASLSEFSEVEFEDLVRFNESIDQTLTEALDYYSSEIETSRSLFLGVLCHDLRNPLTAVQMCAELIPTIGTLDAQQHMLIKQVSTSADRAEQIVTHLLDLTRARFGAMFPLIKSDMDIAFVARELVAETRSLHPDRQINLEIVGETEGFWDKPRLGQVFSNLLGNAVQYGFADLPIRVRIEGGTDEVTLSVCNDGVPIPPDAIGGVFNALSRARTKDQYDRRSSNLGLGLYITSEIARAHSGSITVTSTEKAGTTFTVTLPRFERSTGVPRLN